MRYQLWDQDHANMVSDFADLASALGFVRAELATRGTEGVVGLALLHVGADHRILEPVAQGLVLLELSQLAVGAS